MRHIWICIIDGCIVRSGPVQPSDTMPTLLERLMRSFPHMAPDSVKVICEDGRIFDSELGFSSVTAADPGAPDIDDVLAAVGVVEGHVGVKVHHGKTADEILNEEAHVFSGKIDDNMDFGIFDFCGDQLLSIEDMIVRIGPEQVSEPSPRSEGQGNRRRRARRMPHRRRRRGEKPEGGSSRSTSASSSEGNASPEPPPSSDPSPSS